MSNLYAYPDGQRMTITGVQDGGFSPDNPLTISQTYPQFSGPSITQGSGGVYAPGENFSVTNDWGSVIKWSVIGVGGLVALWYFAKILK